MELAIYLDLFIRILASVGLGFLLGFEREITGKFAGLRTHILVCLGATLFTILSLYGFKHVIVNGINGINDPARIAAQIITGIGFIGAGTVMRQGMTVSGITTAATLWVSAAVGMACGCGMYYIAIFASFITLIVLVAIRHFERKYLINKVMGIKSFDISFSCPIKEYEKIDSVIMQNFTSINRIKKKITKGEHYSIKLNVTTKKNIAKINEIFKNLDSLDLLEIQEEM